MVTTLYYTKILGLCEIEFILKIFDIGQNVDIWFSLLYCVYKESVTQLA